MSHVLSFKPRRRLSCFFVAICLVASAMWTAPPAFAHAPSTPTKKARTAPQRTALIRALAGIDTVPSAAALRRAAPVNTALKLKKLALDAHVDGWIRLRAVSVLPALGVVSSAHLLSLAQTSKLPKRMRWWAAFGWLRSPVSDSLAVAQARIWLAHRSWLVREAAVRGLRHRDSPSVTKLLRAALETERHGVVRATLRRLLQRR